MVSLLLFGQRPTATPGTLYQRRRLAGTADPGLSALLMVV